MRRRNIQSIGLPDGNGWDLLRDLWRGREFKAIAMSGHNTEQDRQRSVEAGFAEHLAKPLLPEELEAALERATARGPE